MPRFFFDVHDGEKLTPDQLGLELPDLHAAQQEAVRTLPEVAKDALPDGTQRDFLIEVRDHDKRPVLRAKLSLSVEKLPGV